MKKREIEKIFRKLDLKVRNTGHNYGWLVLDGKKILRVHYSQGRDIPDNIVNKVRGQLKLESIHQMEDFQIFGLPWQRKVTQDIILNY